MLTTIGQSLTIAAILGNAVVYGTDVFGGLVMRDVYTRLDDATVTTVAGLSHYYADKRMPIAGAGGLITALLAVIVLATAGHIPAAIAAGLAVAALVTWLALYVRVAKPINTLQTAAALSGEIPANARALNDSWFSVIYPRVALQTTGLIALAATLTLV